MTVKWDILNIFWKLVSTGKRKEKQCQFEMLRKFGWLGRAYLEYSENLDNLERNMKCNILIFPFYFILNDHKGTLWIHLNTCNWRYIFCFKFPVCFIMLVFPFLELVENNHKILRLKTILSLQEEKKA